MQQLYSSYSAHPLDCLFILLFLRSYSAFRTPVLLVSNNGFSVTHRTKHSRAPVCVTPSVSVCDQCVYFQSGTKHIFVPEGGGILAKRRMPCSLFFLFFHFVFIEMKTCRKVTVLLFSH